MNQPKMPEDTKLIQAYFYGLIKTPDLPPPAALEPQTAGIVRQLVAIEQQAVQSNALLLEQAKERVRQRVLAHIQPGATLAADKISPNQEATGKPIFDNPPVAPMVRRLQAWSKRAVLAGMVATIALVSLVMWLIIASINGVEAPNLGTGGQTQTSTLSYRLDLQAITSKPDAKALKLTRLIIDQRLLSFGLKDYKLNDQGSNGFSLQAAGLTDAKLLTRLLAGQGLVEFILVNGEQLKSDEAVQTTFCTTGTLNTSKVTYCDALRTGKALGRLNDSDQPFQTIISNDLSEFGGQANQDYMTVILTNLKKMYSKLINSNPKMSVGVALDGKILGTIQLNNFSNNNADITISSDGSEQGKIELTLLTIMLKYGAYPLSLEIVK